VPIQDRGKVIITLEVKYERLVTDRMQLYGFVKGKGFLPINYEIQEVDLKEKEDKLFVTLVLKNYLNEFKEGQLFQYELYLENRSYFSMLLESSN